MRGTLNDMAKKAAKLVIDTLTAVDYVTIVRYSDDASASSSTLEQATDANKIALKAWIDRNIDADGLTNFRAAFKKAWQVVDATTASSNCNRIMLFLSDGSHTVGSDWAPYDSQDVGATAKSYSPPMYLLTYGLGEGAKADDLKAIACAGNGIYYSVRPSTLANTMASYFQVRIARLDG